jgi:hypothetical protein
MMHMCDVEPTGLVIFLVQSARCCWRLIFRHRAVEWVLDALARPPEIIFQQLALMFVCVCCYCERIQMMGVLLLSCALSSSLLYKSTRRAEHCKTHRDVCHLLVLLTLWKEPSTFNFLPAPSLRLFDLRARARDEKNCVFAARALPFALLFSPSAI